MWPDFRSVRACSIVRADTAVIRTSSPSRGSAEAGGLRPSPAAPTSTWSSSTCATASSTASRPRTASTRSASRSTATPSRTTPAPRWSPPACGSAPPPSPPAASRPRTSPRSPTSSPRRCCRLRRGQGHRPQGPRHRAGREVPALPEPVVHLGVRRAPPPYLHYSGAPRAHTGQWTAVPRAVSAPSSTRRSLGGACAGPPGAACLCARPRADGAQLWRARKPVQRLGAGVEGPWRRRGDRVAILLPQAPESRRSTSRSTSSAPSRCRWRSCSARGARNIDWQTPARRRSSPTAGLAKLRKLARTLPTGAHPVGRRAGEGARGFTRQSHAHRRDFAAARRPPTTRR